MRAVARAAQFFAFAFLVAFLAGFAIFAREAVSLGPDDAARGDALVVFTGGVDRIPTAVRLLDEGRGGRLLISGVNPDVPIDEVREASGASQPLFDCCIDAGAEAVDTIGNATETADWARENAFTRIVVVTSDYHMPRALLELRTALPEGEFIAYGVRGPAPWTNARAARRWLQEYLKYVAVYGRELPRQILR
ncbi:MAG: YdcF family protein [Pseudomonadota bacterium]